MSLSFFISFVLYFYSQCIPLDLEQHATNHIQPLHSSSNRRDRAKSRDRGERFATVNPPYIDDGNGRDRNHNIPNGVGRGRGGGGRPYRQSSLDKDYKDADYADHYGHTDHSNRLGVHDSRDRSRRSSRDLRPSDPGMFGDGTKRPNFSASQYDVRPDNSNDSYWGQGDFKDSSRSYGSSHGHLDTPNYNRERRRSQEFDRSPLRRDAPERASAPDREYRDRQYRGQDAQDFENANLSSSRGSRERHTSQPNNVLPNNPNQSRHLKHNVASPNLQDFLVNPPPTDSSRPPYSSTPTSRGRDDNRGHKSPYIDDPTQRHRDPDGVFIDDDFTNANTTQDSTTTRNRQRDTRDTTTTKRSSSKDREWEGSGNNYRRLPNKPRDSEERGGGYGNTKSGKDKRKYRDEYGAHERDNPYSVQQEGVPRTHGTNTGRVLPPPHDEVKTL